MEEKEVARNWIRNLSTTRVIALSFFCVILIGTLLLCLPISARNGEWTPFLNAMFTATSATCVTGLVVYDTFTHWTVFGQLVILVMIQIGGIGLMTIISTFAIFFKKKIGLHERMLLKESAGNTRISGMVVLVRRIIKGTIIFEAVGAVILMFRFCPKMGFLQGTYYAVFHAVSAFCNAGFDLMGRYEAFSSLTAYETDLVVNIVIMLLIIIGGIGFFVWSDIINCKGKFREFSLHSQIVIVTTVILLVTGTVGYLIFEGNGNLKGMSGGERMLSAAFMSVTSRTAGFNTMDMGSLSEAGSLLTMILMFIGASAGSTGGGLKCGRVLLLFKSLRRNIRKILNPQKVQVVRNNGEMVSEKVLDNTNAYLAAYVVIIILSVVLVSLDNFSTATNISAVLACFNNIGPGLEAVGPTCNFSAYSTLSKLVLIFDMLAGRLEIFPILALFTRSTWRHR